ncbi:MAG: fibronectin type III domain-containing protein [Verrucomicrobia bacterium]|nr:fibronectin type III domain-containing protein [Verrucomicrobiota bacterium]
MSWSPSATASGYTVFRDGNLIASVTGTSHLDTGCLPDTTYSYTVTADNVTGSSAPSLPVYATTYFSALSNYSMRLVSPGFAVNTTNPSYTFRGQAGLGLTNGVRWSNSLNGLTGMIPFTGQTNSSGWAWSNLISLATGTNRINFSSDYPQASLQTGRDSATNSGYASGWNDGSSGGNGFGAWSFSNSGTAGFFRADASHTNMSVGAVNGFGMFASGGGSARASRNIPALMKSGDVLTLRFDNNWIDNGARVGMALANSSGSNRLNFYFIGGLTNYYVDDSISNRDTSWSYKGDGFLITVSLTSPNTYSMNIGGSSLTGTLGGSGAISQLAVYNLNAGAGLERNLYVGEMTFSESQTNLVTILSAADVVYNPMTEGIPNGWWIEFFGTTSGVSASADADGDGFTNLQEYALGTDPRNAGSSFKVGEMSRSGTSLTISWPSVAGKRYQVQTATQLGTSSWQNAGDVVTPSISGTSTVTVPVAADTVSCFVRVNLLP